MLNFGLLGGKVRPVGYILNPPTNLSGIGSDEGGGVFASTLTWDAPIGNTEATVSYLLYKDDVYLATIPDGTLTYVDNEVLPDNGYSYSIRTKDVAGFNSEYSLAVAVAIPNLVLPSKPSVPTVAPRGVDSRTLSWSASTDGSYSIVGYIVQQDGDEVARTSNLTATVYFESRKREDIKWTIIAVDSEGWLSSESDEADDTGNSDIDPLSDAIEWNYIGGGNPQTSRVFLGAMLQNETPINNDAIYVYGGLDNQFNAILGDAEFSFKNEYIGNTTHSLPLCLMITDTDNYIGLRVFNGNIEVYEKVGGVFFRPMSVPYTVNKTDTFMIKSVGQVITAYRNGVEIMNYTTTLPNGYAGYIQRQAGAGNNYLGGFFKLEAVVLGRPAITLQPVDAVIATEGDPATFTSDGTDFDSIEWQYHNGSVWGRIGGADTEKDYTFADSTGAINMPLRVVYTNVVGDTISNEVAIRVAITHNNEPITFQGEMIWK